MTLYGYWFTKKYFIEPWTIPKFNKRLSCHSEQLNSTQDSPYILYINSASCCSSQFKLIFYISRWKLHCTCISSTVRHNMSKEGDVMKNHLSYESVFNTTCMYIYTCFMVCMTRWAHSTLESYSMDIEWCKNVTFRYITSNGDG